MSAVTVMLAGIGGYGQQYLQGLFDLADAGRIEISGLVDPFPQACPYLGEVQKRGLKIYDTLEAFYAQGTCDLACISTPIQFHTAMILTALQHGSHVLCEKPLTGDVRDIERLIKARDDAGKFVMVGYQWSHSDAVLAMKRDILSGVYGTPQMLKTVVLWPRNKAYFSRGIGWAGKIAAADGTLILDSIANNAAAHYLHNAFFVLGDAPDCADPVETVSARLYRGNAIENFDTAIIQCDMKCGARLLYIASHTVDRQLDPLFEYRFSGGVLRYDENQDGQIVGTTSDGTVRNYGNPGADLMRKLELAVENVTAETPFIPCGIEAASVQTACIAQCALQDIEDIPKERLCFDSQRELLYVQGLYEELCALYENDGDGL